MNERTSTAVATRVDGHDAAVTWLEGEFPGWRVSLGATASWNGDLRALWIAERPGHHPQAELSAAKLHTRLGDYHDREDRRRSLAN